MQQCSENFVAAICVLDLHLMPDVCLGYLHEHMRSKKSRANQCILMTNKLSILQHFALLPCLPPGLPEIAATPPAELCSTSRALSESSTSVPHKPGRYLCTSPLSNYWVVISIMLFAIIMGGSTVY